MVTITNDTKGYDLAEFRIDKESIICEDFSVDLESSEELKTSINSHDAIGYKGGARELSWDANSVDPSHYTFLKECWKNRTNFTVSTYNFEEGGDLKESDVLLNCRIESISIKQEEGRSLDISGKALSIK